MEDKKKKTTQTDLLLRYVKEKAKNHNIPVILIAGDREKGQSCYVMDIRQEAKDINISLLLDAMANQSPVCNVVLGAAAIMAAEIPEIEARFAELVARMRASAKEAKTIANTAEA